MQQAPADSILQYLRTVLGGRACKGKPDQELVGNFVSEGDQAAFAGLLERHGPMVLGICRRIVPDEHLAEDAFQATFLLLARKANSIRNKRSVASWLHGVALRLARKANSDLIRSRRADTRSQARTVIDPVTEASWREARDILDGELQKLPEKYRLPLVLCYLESRTRDESAAQLGWSLDKFRGLLERGRAQLRTTLIRRGVTLAAAGTGFLLADTVLAARVPPLLAIATVKAAAAFASGKSLATCGVSLSVITLTKGALSIMSLKNFAMVTALALIIGLGGASVGLVASLHGAIPHTETKAEAKQNVTIALKQKNSAQVPGPKPALDNYGDPLPPGALFRFGSLHWRHDTTINGSALAPDGKRLVTSSGSSVVVWDMDTGKMVWRFLTDHGSYYSRTSLSFSPDGKRLGYVHNHTFACVWDLETGNEIRRFETDRNSAYHFCLFTPDGKEFILIDQVGLHVWDLELGKEKRSAAIKSVNMLSPDAATYLTAKINVDEKDEAKNDKKTDANSNLSDITLGDARTGAQTIRLPNSFSFHLSVRDSIAFAPDCRSIALVNTAKRQIQIRDMAKLQLQVSFPLPQSASFHFGKEEHFDYHIAFSADGKIPFLGTVGGTIHRWDLNANKELPPLEKHAIWLFSTVCGVHQSPDGKTVISVGVDGVIRRWDATTGKEHTDRKSYAGNVCAALSPDGRLTVVGDSGGRVDLWDVRNGKLVRNFVSEGPIINKVAFAPDGKSLAVGYRSGNVTLYDVPTGSNTKKVAAEDGHACCGP